MQFLDNCVNAVEHILLIRTERKLGQKAQKRLAPPRQNRVFVTSKLVAMVSFGLYNLLRIFIQ